jgi:hypothetical protein
MHIINSVHKVLYWNQLVVTWKLEIRKGEGHALLQALAIGFLE